LANSTLRRRISTLSSWFTWLEDEEMNVGPRCQGPPANADTRARSRGWTVAS